MIADLRCVVLDCPDPAQLARFYGALLGGDVDRPGRRVYADPAGHPFCLVRH